MGVVSRAINAKRFSQVMREMARVPSRASAAICRDIEREIQRNMDRSVDPYGRPWRKKANGQRTTLTKTGAGRASIKATPTSGAGFKITVGLLRMIYHQFGGMSHLKGPSGTSADRKKNKNFGRDKDRSTGRNNPPKRSFLPFERLPRSWGEIVLARIEEAAQAVLKRG